MERAAMRYLVSWGSVANFRLELVLLAIGHEHNFVRFSKTIGVAPADHSEVLRLRL